MRNLFNSRTACSCRGIGLTNFFVTFFDPNGPKDVQLGLDPEIELTFQTHFWCFLSFISLHFVLGIVVLLEHKITFEVLFCAKFECRDKNDLKNTKRNEKINKFKYILKFVNNNLKLINNWNLIWFSIILIKKNMEKIMLN